MLAICLPEDIETRLEKLANETGRSKTYYAREAILEYIEGWEDHHLAVSRIEKKLPTISLAEAEKRLGLAD